MQPLRGCPFFTFKNVQTPEQIENLRYECEPTTGWSHEYVSEFAKQTTKTRPQVSRIGMTT